MNARRSLNILDRQLYLLKQTFQDREHAFATTQIGIYKIIKTHRAQSICHSVQFDLALPGKKQRDEQISLFSDIRN